MSAPIPAITADTRRGTADGIGTVWSFAGAHATGKPAR